MTAKDPYGSLEKGTGFDLKPLSLEAVPRALERADRYRLLPEPRKAETICLDTLGADPGTRKALPPLVLARTDQSARAPGVDIARRARSCRGCARSSTAPTTRASSA